MKVIYFWQQMLSPHMTALASSMLMHGWKVVFVAGQNMAIDRARLGWRSEVKDGLLVEFVPDKTAVERIVRDAPPHSIHLCEGVRANGIVGQAQNVIWHRGLANLVVMETLQDNGFSGLIKRLLYRFLFFKHRRDINGVLAIGYLTKTWLVNRGVEEDKIFPFAYFLRETEFDLGASKSESDRFRFVFAGQLIKRKRLDLLLDALSQLTNHSFEFLVIGDGPEKVSLGSLADSKLIESVKWIGQLNMSVVRQRLAEADCLVLPSRHDGWGAVVTEALMAGTRVICSDACGSAGVAVLSGNGLSFKNGDIISLMAALDETIELGRVSAEERGATSEWAKALGASAGAAYLDQILTFKTKLGVRPVPPWES